MSQIGSNPIRSLCPPGYSCCGTNHCCPPGTNCCNTSTGECCDDLAETHCVGGVCYDCFGCYPSACAGLACDANNPDCTCQGGLCKDSLGSPC